MLKESATVRVHKERTAEWLLEHGWWMSDEGWHHRNLNNGKFPWPMTQAAMLQVETNNGSERAVSHMLRGHK